MLFKDVEYESEEPHKIRASQLFYLLYNPGWTIPGSVLLALLDTALIPLLALHALNLALFKAVPMRYWGANSQTDISNHVSSAVFFVMALQFVGILSMTQFAVVFAFVLPTAFFSVLFRNQHDLPGAALGALSSALIFTAVQVTTSFATMVAIATLPIAALYLPVYVVDDWKRVFPF